MKVLFCTPEVYPFSKLGGLADFSASLPKSLNNLSNEVYVVSPYYEKVRNEFGDSITFIGEKEIEFDNTNYLAKYYSIVYDDVTYFFVGNEFFRRDSFFNYSDDIKRFIFLNIAILEMLPIINFYPDLIHVNDWSTSLIPYYLGIRYESNPNYNKIKTLLTIHNLEKQGIFDRKYEHLFDHKSFTYLHLNSINFLKTGIMRASEINTVSKSYRSEMLTKFFGFSLDGALKSRQLELHGIQNGLDFNLYNPGNAKYLSETYSSDTFIKGKKTNKEMLLKELGFSNPEKIVISFISRFAREKGITLIEDVIEEYLKNDLIYFIAVGQGDIQYENYFKTLKTKYPDNFYYHQGHSQKVNQKVYAASDILLMPSLYEASGLNQMIAMRYGTLPLVRATGGLKDTVSNFDINSKSGTGFVFENFDSDEFKNTIDYAIELYNTNKDAWNSIIKNAMTIDNDINKMARAYNELYVKIINE